MHDWELNPERLGSIQLKTSESLVGITLAIDFMVGGVVHALFESYAGICLTAEEKNRTPLSE
jgi:hypothetical protein